jgi:hypothetical protein
MAEEQVYEEHHDYPGDTFQAPEPEPEQEISGEQNHSGEQQQDQDQKQGQGQEQQQTLPRKQCPGYVEHWVWW